MQQDFSSLMVSGRSCGSCSMCCKLFEVPWVDNKPRGQWCKHSQPGRGCGIWQSRPQRCRDYFCQWFFASNLSEDWRPDISKFILNLSPDEFWLEIVVDMAQPNAWKREPYGSTLRRIAASHMSEGKGLMLHVGARKFIVTPTEEIAISQFPEDCRFRFSASRGPSGPLYEIAVVTNQSAAVGG